MADIEKVGAYPSTFKLRFPDGIVSHNPTMMISPHVGSEDFVIISNSFGDSRRSDIINFVLNKEDFDSVILAMQIVRKEMWGDDGY